MRRLVAGFAIAGALSSLPLGHAEVFAPVADTVLSLPADGRLSFSAFAVPAGVSVSFDGAASMVVIEASDRIAVEGTLDAGARALSSMAPSVSFGDHFFLCGRRQLGNRGDQLRWRGQLQPSQ